MTVYDDYGLPVGTHSEPESLAHQAWRVVRAFALYRVKPEISRTWADLRRRDWSMRRRVNAVSILVVVWWVAVYWGERSAIRNSVDQCHWTSWERWESGAIPHRLIFIADPQLVDPHTYPGRPWPLNTLTVQYTDQYLRRTYSRIQQVLRPDTVFFLGDLFDGGREWSTRRRQNPDKHYSKYGDDFWMNEYRRFGGIFFEHWRDGGVDPRLGQPGRKLISSLPGNHDLGFANGVQVSVRQRFHAYFGEGNRIDVVGNHTFVSIDSVSLSALGQPNPESSEDLWKPTMTFLENARKQKRRLVQRELRIQQGLHPYPGYDHEVIETDRLARAELPHSNEDITEFPTILLTHVPLYRLPGTPCGPMREHWPPTPVKKGQEPLEKDNRNAISVSGGYQYQNVLNREITVDIADKIGDIRYAFSGDDHDYCEVLHRAYASAGSGIKEITVKSLSWAMGVRHPGMVMVSMWNPVDKLGKPLSGDASSTLQTHLCLMPDQLGIFIQYALLFCISLFILGIRAALIATGVIKPHPSTESPLLPTNSSSAEYEKASLVSQQSTQDSTNAAHSSNSSTSSEHNHLQVRSVQSRVRSASPVGGYGFPANHQQPSYPYPLVQHAGYFGPSEGQEGRKMAQAKAWGAINTMKSKPRTKGTVFRAELISSIGKVAMLVFTWYFWLIYRW